MRNKTNHTITWMHFSDLHLCHPRTGWESDQILKALKKDLRNLQDEFDLRPDLIFFTGDAIFGNIGEGEGKSIVDQFREAENLFESIRNLFEPSIPKENFFIVPGNHDLNRKKASGLLNEGLASLNEKNYEEVQKYLSGLIHDNGANWQGFMNRLADYRNYLEVFEYDHLVQDSDRLIYAVHREINGIKVGIAGLNSSWSCYQNGEKGKLWFAGHWQIQALKNKLDETDFNIALMHHPFNWFNPAEDPYVKQEMENNFNFFLHGHEHQGWVTAHTSGFTRIASGAGYGSSEKETGYNVVRLDFEQGKGQVWLRTYDTNGGWVKKIIYGKAEDGIWPIELFKSKIFREPVPSECGEPPEPKKKVLNDVEQAGEKYNLGNCVFNVPYREKGKGVVGREEALEKLRKQLTESYGTAIGQTASFHGIGGLGKTQLAVEYAHSFKDDYSNGVIWINADQEIEPQLIQISKKGNWIAPESEHKLILEIATRRLKTFSECLIIFSDVRLGLCI